MIAVRVTVMLFVMAAVGIPAPGFSQSTGPGRAFPVEPELFLDGHFERCEGLAFNGQGRLFASCNSAVWEVTVDGDARHVADLHSNLGIAGIGDRDILVADFGPTNAFRHGRNHDGIVWRVTPNGEKSVASRGFGDPNFILVREDGSYLVSDDATSDIYSVSADGEVALYTTAVNHPNGMVLALDRKTLYVAQTFANIKPIVSGNELWSISLTDRKPATDARLAARVAPDASPDGLAMDEEGRVYIAANYSGKIWRYAPETGAVELIAEGLFGAASIAFGEGPFDPTAIYVTTTYAGGRGGKIWKIDVGVSGATMVR